ncbi:hypothetical protein BJ912DRAFT_996382 [Pholiota molesta]|nr:hypothetical protein BJ912DRAFT_996382 [Pholiota molesta]
METSRTGQRRTSKRRRTTPTRITVHVALRRSLARRHPSVIVRLPLSAVHPLSFAVGDAAVVVVIVCGRSKGVRGCRGDGGGGDSSVDEASSHRGARRATKHQCTAVAHAFRSFPNTPRIWRSSPSAREMPTQSVHNQHAAHTAPAAFTGACRTPSSTRLL